MFGMVQDLEGSTEDHSLKHPETQSVFYFKPIVFVL